MRVFTNNTFHGHFPVGSAAVVTACDAEDAALLLTAYLAGIGLIQKDALKADDMIELKHSLTPQIRVLCNGDY